MILKPETLEFYLRLDEVYELSFRIGRDIADLTADIDDIPFCVMVLPLDRKRQRLGECQIPSPGDRFQIEHFSF